MDNMEEDEPTLAIIIKDLAVMGIMIVVSGGLGGLMVGGFVGTVAAYFAENPVATYQSIVLGSMPVGIITAIAVVCAVGN